MSKKPLQWVIFQGKLHHINEYSSLPPSGRPKATCPLCGNEIIMRIGEKRQYHIAHFPGVLCPSDDPSEVIKQNIKYHIYSELSRDGDNKLRVVSKCRTSIDEKKYETLLAEFGDSYCQSNCFKNIYDWDSVEIDFRYGRLFFDLALKKDNKVICLIKIIETKQSSIKSSIDGIPYIEVSSGEEIYLPDKLWNIKSKLHVLNPVGYCYVCRQKVDVSTSAPKTYLIFTVVDLYFSSGKKFRQKFNIIKMRESGNVLLQDTHKNCIAETMDDRREGILFLFKQLDEYLKRKYSNSQALIDYVMPWKRYDSLKGSTDVREQPYNYIFDGFEWRNRE